MPHTITEKCTGCTVCAKSCPVKAVSGEKGSRHSINPAVCFDCSACGRLCPSSAITDQNGFKVSRQKKSEWPKPDFDLKNCISCRACIKICPAGCISAEPGLPGGSGVFPKLSKPEACVSCGWCKEACPESCINMKQEFTQGRLSRRENNQI